MTFSIVAKCADTGQFGLAISSSSPAVAARCAFAKAGVGAVATQNVTNPALGPMVLEYLESGFSASDAVRSRVKTLRNESLCCSPFLQAECCLSCIC